MIFQKINKLMSITSKIFAKSVLASAYFVFVMFLLRNLLLKDNFFDYPEFVEQ